jgi:hypothetical protein
MSERNGDRARFQKDRKRKLLHRQRVRSLETELRKRTNALGATDPSVTALLTDAVSVEASQAMHDEGGPLRTGD